METSLCCLWHHREEVGKLQEELDKVKDLYVQASHDLSQQEEVLRSKDKDVQDAVAAGSVWC